MNDDNLSKQERTDLQSFESFVGEFDDKGEVALDNKTMKDVAPQPISHGWWNG